MERTKCPFDYEHGSDALPADRLHLSAACYVYGFGDVDGVGGTRRLDNEGVYEMLTSAQHMAELAEQNVKLAVMTARDHGKTWQEIGAWIGITEQAARRRYGRPQRRARVASAR